MNLTKWELEQDELTRRRIGKTTEEAFELNEAVSRLGQKLARMLLQGVGAVNPSTGKELVGEVEKEIADVYAQLDETVEALGLNPKAIKERRNEKRALMREWEEMYK